MYDFKTAAFEETIVFWKKVEVKLTSFVSPENQECAGKTYRWNSSLIGHSDSWELTDSWLLADPEKEMF